MCLPEAQVEALKPFRVFVQQKAEVGGWIVLYGNGQQHCAIVFIFPVYEVALGPTVSMARSQTLQPSGLH